MFSTLVLDFFFLYNWCTIRVEVLNFISHWQDWLEGPSYLTFVGCRLRKNRLPLNEHWILSSRKFLMNKNPCHQYYITYLHDSLRLHDVRFALLCVRYHERIVLLLLIFAIRPKSARQNNFHAIFLYNFKHSWYITIIKDR